LNPVIVLKNRIDDWLENNPTYNINAQIQTPLQVPTLSAAILSLEHLIAARANQIARSEQSAADGSQCAIHIAFQSLLTRLKTEGNVQDEIIEGALLSIRENYPSFLSAFLTHFNDTLRPSGTKLWDCARHHANLEIQKILLDHRMLMQDMNSYLITLLTSQGELKEPVIDSLLIVWPEAQPIPQEAIQATLDRNDLVSLAKLLERENAQLPPNLYLNLLSKFNGTYTPLQEELYTLKRRFNGNDFSCYLALKFIDILTTIAFITCNLLPLAIIAGGSALIKYDILPGLGWVMGGLGALALYLQYALYIDDSEGECALSDCVATNVIQGQDANDARRMQALKGEINECSSPIIAIIKILARANARPTADHCQFAMDHHFPENLTSLLERNTLNTITAYQDRDIMTIINNINSPFFGRRSNLHIEVATDDIELGGSTGTQSIQMATR
jgi:hypothetical protein